MTINFARRLTRFLFLTALAISVALSACSVTHRYTPEEAVRRPQVVYDQVVVPARIAGVVLEVQKSSFDSSVTGSSSALTRLNARPDSLATVEKALIRFDSNGGRLIRDSNLLVGNDIKEQAVILPFDSIVSLQFGGIDQGLTLTTVPQAIAAQDLVLAHRDKAVGRGKYANWNVIRFDRQGATIDSTSHRLTGVSRGGVPVSVSLADAVNLSYTNSFFEQVKLHPYRASRVAVALIIIGVVVFGPFGNIF